MRIFRASLPATWLAMKCRTVTECGWAGKKNGELLSLAEPAFDAMLTLDKSVPYQQDVSSRRIAVLIVRARSNRGLGSSGTENRLKG